MTRKDRRPVSLSSAEHTLCGYRAGIGGWQLSMRRMSITNDTAIASAGELYGSVAEGGRNQGLECVDPGGSGCPAIDTGFACNQFNHAIAVAIAGSDSIWLECTSQLLPPDTWAAYC